MMGQCLEINVSNARLRPPLYLSTFGSVFSTKAAVIVSKIWPCGQTPKLCRIIPASNLRLCPILPIFSSANTLRKASSKRVRVRVLDNPEGLTNAPSLSECISYTHKGM